jgi:hypothetical protein
MRLVLAVSLVLGLIMALRPAQAGAFFPAPSGDLGRSHGYGSPLVTAPSRPLTPRYVACLRTNRAIYAAMFNNATIAIQRCRGIR